MPLLAKLSTTTSLTLHCPPLYTSGTVPDVANNELWNLRATNRWAGGGYGLKWLACD